MFSRTPFFLLFCALYGSMILLCPSEAKAAAVWFVTQAGSGDKSGSDWDNACGEAQFPAKIQNAATGDELWVAKGVYRPSTTGNTSAHFTLKTGVALYGGFGGAETDRNERNVTGNPTILTGDLANDDEGKVDGVTVSADQIRGSNSRCVVVGSGVDGSAILDGFTISAGNNLADGAPAHGGGMYNQNGSPKIRNCTFAGNFAASKGGGLFNDTANPTLTNCTFLGNRSQDGGGGIGNEGSGNFTISGCTFSGNWSGSGGGIFNISSSSPSMTNCTFSGNSAIIGGAIFNEGSSPIVMNCTFFGNTAAVPPTGGGGGMCNNGDGFFTSSDPVVTNCIFWNNSNGEILDYYSSPTVNYCVIQGGYSGPGGAHIFVADPFLGPLSRNGGPTETLQLFPGSSAIDKGTGAGAPATDQRGVTRPQGLSADIGAYESWSKKILTVDVSGAGTVNRAPAGDVFGTTGECWTYDEDTSVVLDASPDAGNMFVEWSGALTGSADSGTITMSMDHAVSALFDIAWIITASAGPHGDIAPKGEVIVRNNTDQTFTVSPDFGYDISGVAVDDVPVGTASTYTFHPVVEDHTIEASFDLKRYHIVAEAGPNGSIDPSGDITVVHGTQQTFLISPNAGYNILDVATDGVSVGPITEYTFPDISADHTIEASFDIKRYHIVATAGPNGSIDPSGDVTVVHSADQTFAITPDTGFDVAVVAVDDVPVGAVTSYTFQSVSADHTIHASFEPVPTPTPVPTITPTPTPIPTPTAVPTVSPGPSTTPTTTPTGEPTPSPTSAPTGSPDPTSTPKPSVSPMPTLIPHPSPDPDIPLPGATLTLTLVSGGRIIVGPWDIFDTEARLELLESPSLWAQLLATDPDALAAGDFNIGLVRFLSFFAELDRDELEITILFKVTVGDASAGYRAVVFLLMRTFDALGKPTGYVVVPKSEGKNVFLKKTGTEIWKVTVRDGGATDGDGKRNGYVMPQVAAVVAVFPTATPTATMTPTQGSMGSGGGCSIPASGGAALAALLLLAPVVLMRRR